LSETEALPPAKAKSVIVSLSVLTAIFQVMELVVTTVSHAKLQSNRHHQQTNTQLFTGRMPFSCHPTNSVKAMKGKNVIVWAL